MTGDSLFDERFEAPTVGRWLSTDPLGFRAGDSNLYRYALNTPTYLGDPSGEDSVGPFPLGDTIGKEIIAEPPHVEPGIVQMKLPGRFVNGLFVPFDPASMQDQIQGLLNQIQNLQGIIDQLNAKSNRCSIVSIATFPPGVGLDGYEGFQVGNAIIKGTFQTTVTSTTIATLGVGAILTITGGIATFEGYYYSSLSQYYQARQFQYMLALGQLQQLQNQQNQQQKQ